MVEYRKMVKLLNELTDSVKNVDSGIVSVEIRDCKAKIHVSTDRFWMLAKYFKASVEIDPSFNTVISKSEPGYKWEQYQFTVNDVTFFTIMDPEEESEYGVRVRT